MTESTNIHELYRNEALLRAEDNPTFNSLFALSLPISYPISPFRPSLQLTLDLGMPVVAIALTTHALRFRTSPALSIILQSSLLELAVSTAFILMGKTIWHHLKDPFRFLSRQTRHWVRGVYAEYKLFTGADEDEDEEEQGEVEDVADEDKNYYEFYGYEWYARMWEEICIMRSAAAGR